MHELACGASKLVDETGCGVLLVGICADASQLAQLRHSLLTRAHQRLQVKKGSKKMTGQKPLAEFTFSVAAASRPDFLDEVVSPR